MTAHTPGPWTAIPDSGEDSEGDWYVLAEDEDTMTAGVSKADAHLIAAAPDMLAALRPLVEYLQNNGGDAEYHDADGTGWLTRARAAIAKAEGTS